MQVITASVCHQALGILERITQPFRLLNQPEQLMLPVLRQQAVEPLITFSLLTPQAQLRQPLQPLRLDPLRISLARLLGVAQARRLP
jgi:hypothetical protein